MTVRLASLCISSLLFVAFAANARELPESVTVAVKRLCSPTRTARELPSIEIIIDDSGSMRGFVSAENGDIYRKVIENLTGTLADHHFAVRALHDLDGIVKTSRPLTPNFYSGADTPLRRAFDVASSDRSGSIFVIISDLIQPRSELGRVCGALKKALRVKPAMQVLGIRSAFSTQTRPQCAPQCRAEAHPAVYVIVLAPDDEALQLFEARTHLVASSLSADMKFTLDRRNGPYLFYSKIPAIEVLRVVPVEIDGWRAEALAESACGSFVTVMSSIAETKVPLRLRLSTTVNDPDVYPAKAHFAVARVHSPQLASIEAIRPDLITHDRVLPLFFGELEVTYRIGSPPSGWDVYRVRLMPAEESLLSPDWVGEWSKEAPIIGENDTVSIADNIIQTALHAVTQMEPMLEHFIAVHRRRK